MHRVPTNLDVPAAQATDLAVMAPSTRPSESRTMRSASAAMAMVVRHHDYSEILLGIQGSQNSQDFPRRWRGRDFRWARRPTGLAAHRPAPGRWPRAAFRPPTVRAADAQAVARPDESQQFPGLLRLLRGAAQISPHSTGRSSAARARFPASSAPEAGDRTEKSCRSAGSAKRRGGGPADCRRGCRRNALLRRPERRACQAGAEACSFRSRFAPMIDRNSPGWTSRFTSSSTGISTCPLR